MGIYVSLEDKALDDMSTKMLAAESWSVTPSGRAVRHCRASNPGRCYARTGLPQTQAVQGAMPAQGCLKPAAVCWHLLSS